MATVNEGELDLSRLLATMEPERQPGLFAFATLAQGTSIDTANCICWMREPEGLSVVIDANCLDRLPEHTQTTDYRAAWITLRVHSSLAAIGLTAAIATALSEAGISCNIVAGARHDHLFVSDAMADSALACLRDLQARHAPPLPPQDSIRT